MEDKIKALAIIFQLDPDRLKNHMEIEKKDLYSAVSDLSGISRYQVKLWAHGIMYSTGPIGELNARKL